MASWKVVRGVASPEALGFVKGLPRSAEEAGCRVLRRGNHRITVLVPAIGIVKFYYRFGSRKTLQSLLVPSVLSREFDHAIEAAKRGIPVARPIFVAEKRVMGALVSSVIAIETVAGGISLEEAIRRRHPPPGQKSEGFQRLGRIASAYGRCLAALHRAGAVHGDPSPDNVILDSGLEPVLIDWPFAVFSDFEPPGGLACRLLVRKAQAKRFRLSLKELLAALRGFQAKAQLSSDWRKLCMDDLSKAVLAMLQCGAHLREIAAAARGYEVIFFGNDRPHRVLDELSGSIIDRLRPSIRRTLRNALRSSRATCTVKDGDHYIFFRRTFDEDQVRAAFCNNSAPALPGFEIIFPRRGTVAWKNSCVLARFNIPSRPVAACRSSAAGRDRTALLVARLNARSISTEKELHGAVRLFRLLWAFGFRLREFDNETFMADLAGGPVFLADPSAVDFEPDAGIGRSLRLFVSTYAGLLQKNPLPAADLERPLRFVL